MSSLSISSRLIRTSRLRLVPLDLPQLLQLRKSRSDMEAGMGLTPSAMQTSDLIRKEMDGALKFWIDFVRENPEDFAWGTNWEIILDSENRAVGGIGLNGLPDEAGIVTVGYVIDDRYHGRGLASEALKGLLTWVVDQEKAVAMEALTPVDNLPSQRVLEKNGFAQVNELELEGMRLLAWRLELAGVPENSDT